MPSDDDLRADLVDRLAALALVEESLDAGGEGGAAGGGVPAMPVAEVTRRALSRVAFEGVATIPIGAMPLYRALRTQSALVASPVAFAAATGKEQRRVIDDLEIRTIVEDDAVWLVLTLPEGIVPAVVELTGADGRSVRLPLDPPVERIIQTGVSRTSAAERTVAELLERPDTHIFLL